MILKDVSGEMQELGTVYNIIFRTRTVLV